MAVSLDSGGGGRGIARWKPKAEINVTPFVDVMLVLLIVFMVTAPLRQSSSRRISPISAQRSVRKRPASPPLTTR